MCSQVPDGYKVVNEGKASILEFQSDAFYNPAQVKHELLLNLLVSLTSLGSSARFA